MNGNLPLNTLLEFAEKINKLEEKLSEVLKFVNVSLQQSLQNAKDLEELKLDIASDLSILFKEINNDNKNS